MLANGCHRGRPYGSDIGMQGLRKPREECREEECSEEEGREVKMTVGFDHRLIRVK